MDERSLLSPGLAFDNSVYQTHREIRRISPPFLHKHNGHSDILIPHHLHLLLHLAPSLWDFSSETRAPALIDYHFRAASAAAGHRSRLTRISLDTSGLVTAGRP